MSDYFAGLLDRHLGLGEMVLPRAPAKFETGTSAAYFPHEVEEDANPAAPDTETSAADSSGPVTLPVMSTGVNPAGDDNPVKPPVHDQHQPVIPIQLPKVNAKGSTKKNTKKRGQKPAPVPQPIPAAPVRSDIDNNAGNNNDNNNIVFPHEPPIQIPANPPQESAAMRDGVSNETPSTSETTTMKEIRPELKPGNRPGPVIQTVTVAAKIQEGPFDRQSRRQPSAVPGLSPPPEPPVQVIEPRPPMKESQPVTPVLQDTGPDAPGFQAAAASLSISNQPEPLETSPSLEPAVTGAGQTIFERVIVEPQPLSPARQNNVARHDNGTDSRGLLEAPAWLAGEQNRLKQELFSIDSGIEAEPVINVTIGRIEVRAVKQQEPSPPRRYVPPQPKLSLDDYLEQRNRGEI